MFSRSTVPTSFSLISPCTVHDAYDIADIPRTADAADIRSHGHNGHISQDAARSGPSVSGQYGRNKPGRTFSNYRYGHAVRRLYTYRGVYQARSKIHQGLNPVIEIRVGLGYAGRFGERQ